MKRVAEGHVALLVSRLGEVGVALLASRVSDIGVQTSPDAVDVLALLGGRWEHSATRRHVRVSNATGSVVLALGEQLHLREVPVGALHPVPEFLASWSRSLSVAALVRQDGNWFLLIDTDTLGSDSLGPG